MKLQINNQIFTFSEEELETMLIQTKKISKLYKLDDYILNIYNPLCHKNAINEENFEVIRNLKTKRILTPLNLIKDPLTSQFKGYVLPFKSLKDWNKLTNKSLKEILREIKLLLEDINLISNQHIKLNSLTQDDIIYDGNLYFISLGNFEFDLEHDTKTILEYNIFTLNNFLINFLFSLINLSSNEMQQLRIHISKLILHKQQSIIDILEIGDPDEELTTFTKKLGTKKVS